MKLAVLGGGGFRTPYVYRALLRSGTRLGLEELVLHDVSGERLARIEQVLNAIGEERGATVRFRTTTDLDDAVDGADFVFCAIRVGGLGGRVIDETVPLELGVLGQETTGPGGISFALRTIPAMLEIAGVVARRAPRAWFINFTNPAGMVTEALRRVLSDRVVGICDGPPSLCRGVARALELPEEELSFEYAGLNHLGWLTAVRHDGTDRLPELLGDDARLARFEEGRLFGPELLRALGVVPMEYLYYYYYNAEAVDSIRRAGQTRAQILLEQQSRFYDVSGNGADAYELWRAAERARGATYMAEARTGEAGDAHGGDDRGDDSDSGGGYEHVALAVVEGLALDTKPVLILNTANRSALPFLGAETVVEVPSLVRSSGIQPLATGGLPLHARGLVETLKEVEQTTIEAAVSGSPELAVRALMLHPLVPSVEIARRIFTAYRARHAAIRERFA